MKVCTKCSLEKDENNFSPHPKAKGGLRPVCKPCRSIESKLYAERNKEKVYLSRKEYRERNAAVIAKDKREYHAANSAVISSKAKERYVLNREHRLAYQATLRVTDRDAILSREAAYRKANPEKRRAAIARHREENPSLYASYSRKRVAAKKNALPAWASETACRQYYMLAGYLSRELGIPFHVDHKVPLQSNLVCGLHNEFNLNVMLGSWNIAKGNRTWPDMPDRETA